MIILTSCNLIGFIFVPLIGIWETTILGVTVNLTFNADSSCIETNSLGQLGITRQGTWVSSGDNLSLTWANESVEEYVYTIKPDRSEMTLKPTPNGVAITYLRK